MSVPDIERPPAILKLLKDVQEKNFQHFTFSNSLSTVYVY